jgi:hypothetical protein
LVSMLLVSVPSDSFSVVRDFSCWETLMSSFVLCGRGDPAAMPDLVRMY